MEKCRNILAIDDSKSIIEYLRYKVEGVGKFKYFAAASFEKAKERRHPGPQLSTPGHPGYCRHERGFSRAQPEGRIDHRRPIRARAGTTGGLRSRSAVIRAAAPVAASFARRAARPSKLRPGASPPRSSPDSSVNKPLASRSRAAQASLCSARRGINGSPLFRPRAGVALCAPRALRKNEGPDVPRHPTPPLPRDVLAGPCSNTGGANAPVSPSAWIYKQAPCQRFFPV